MTNPRTPQLLAAAAIVALAGTAYAAPYNAVDQDPASGDGLAGYTAAEQDAISDRITDLAGYFDTTVSATVIYNNGGNTITADNVRVTVPVLLWENDGQINTPVLEQITGDVIAGFTGTFTTVGPGFFNPFQLFQLDTAKGTLISFSTVTGANANNVFLDETFDGAEGDAYFGRSNPTGQVLPNGVAIWDANFNTTGPSGQNNTEFLDLDGTSGSNNGNVLPPNSTNFLTPPTVAYGSGIKLLRDPAGPADAGIDDGFATNGGVRLATPSALTDGSSFMQWFGNGFDGAFDGNSNTGTAVNGHTVFRAAITSLPGLTAVDVAAPQHAWPVAVANVTQAPAIPGVPRTDYRNANAKLFRLSCGSSGSTGAHIAGSWAVTGTNGTAGATGEAVVMFIDNFNAASLAGNGYTDGAYYIPASPNFTQGFSATQYAFPASGAGAPGSLNDYRFFTDDVSDNTATPFDVNRDGDIVVTWEDRSDTGTMGNLFSEGRINEIRLYEATINACVADEYSAPITIARTGGTITERGITYNNGFEFNIFKTLFCDGVNAGVSYPMAMSGAAIDDAGNVSFTATSEVFLTDLAVPTADAFAACFDGSEDGSAADGNIDQFGEGGTTGLYYYIRSEDALLELVKGDIGGTELASDVVGAPETLNLVLGRFSSDGDSDRYGSNSMSNTGDTMAVAFRPGSFDRDANNDMDFDDPQGVFLDDGITEEDGGLLLDRTQAMFEDQVVAAVRGIAVVQLGEVVIGSANDCTADFDNDGDVDLGDFGVFGAAFNSMTGDMNYNAAADFDMDGDVDLGDFGVFGAQFGRTDCLD